MQLCSSTQLSSPSAAEYEDTDDKIALSAAGLNRLTPYFTFHPPSGFTYQLMGEGERSIVLNSPSPYQFFYQVLNKAHARQLICSL